MFSPDCPTPSPLSPEFPPPHDWPLETWSSVRRNKNSSSRSRRRRKSLERKSGERKRKTPIILRRLLTILTWKECPDRTKALTASLPSLETSLIKLATLVTQ